MAITNTEINTIIKKEETELPNELGLLQMASKYFVDKRFLAENIRSPQFDNADMNEENAETIRIKRKSGNAGLQPKQQPKKRREKPPQPAASGSTRIGGPAGASHLGPLQQMDENNDSDSDSDNEATS